MKTCLIHSQAMRYSNPSVPSPEMEIIGYAAHELFTKKAVDQFLLAVSTVIKGHKESEISSALLRELGIPAEAIIFHRPPGYTTDAESQALKTYAKDFPQSEFSVLAIEAKKGRLERIAKKSGFYPKIYWAEEVLASSDNQELIRKASEWRRSFRHTILRLRLGLLPLWLMYFDPQAKCIGFLGRIFRS